MDLLQLAGIIIGSILSLGGLIAGAGYGYGQFYKGKNSKILEDTTLFTEQLEALKKIIEEQKIAATEATKKRDGELSVLREDIKKHTEEIGRLKGINEEKEKKIKELTDLLANRDPGLIEYMSFGKKSIEEFQKDVKSMMEALKDISENIKA